MGGGVVAGGPTLPPHFSPRGKSAPWQPAAPARQQQSLAGAAGCHTGGGRANRTSSLPTTFPVKGTKNAKTSLSLQEGGRRNKGGSGEAGTMRATSDHQRPCGALARKDVSVRWP